MTNQNFPAPDGQPEFICPESDTCLPETCLHTKPHSRRFSCIDSYNPICPNCVPNILVIIKDEKPLDDEK